MNMRIAAAIAGALFLVAGSASAANAGQALGKCLYKNSSAAQKDQFIQWAYVTIGKTSAARSIQPIPEAASKKVTEDVKGTLTQLATRSCPKETASVLLSNPKSGATEAMEELTRLMMRDKVNARLGEALNLKSAGGAGTGGGAGGLLRGAGSLLKLK